MTRSNPSPHAGAALTIQKVDCLAPGGLALASPAVDAEGWIDPVHSADGDNASPALTWSRALEAASFALIVEDPDAPGDAPFVHWMIWDIPGTATGLLAGTPAGPRVESLEGAVQGLNGAGRHEWFGPKPPKGHGPHRYHFQLFALGKRLGMGPDTNLADLTNALKANAIACGELVGLFETKDPVADAPSPARTGGYGVEPSNARAPDRDVEAGRGGLDADDPDRHAPHAPSGEVRRDRGEPGRAS